MKGSKILMLVAAMSALILLFCGIAFHNPDWMIPSVLWSMVALFVQQRERGKSAMNDQKERKIIQITATNHDCNQFTQSVFGVFALCDDGTVWATHYNTRYSDWEQLPEMPQPKERP